MEIESVAASLLARNVQSLWDHRESVMDMYSDARWVPWLINKTWAEVAPYKMTMRDWQMLLWRATDHLDCNMWSQIYLNSPLSVFPVYNLEAMKVDLEALRGKFTGQSPSPFDPKAKMTQDYDSDWNKVLILMNGIKILSEGKTFTVWKHYSSNQTPALTDSAGMSRMNSSLDSYIVMPKGRVERIIPEANMAYSLDGGKCKVAGHLSSYESKSQNWDNLIGVLGVRQEMTNQFRAHQGHCTLLPRHTTLSVIVAQT